MCSVASRNRLRNTAVLQHYHIERFLWNLLYLCQQVTQYVQRLAPFQWTLAYWHSLHGVRINILFINLVEMTYGVKVHFSFGITQKESLNQESGFIITVQTPVLWC